ncbi:unnamed protein product [Urochloa decumbens]|uniref:Uncharacterized protein n=1 Tax=Urochloa decumbens TaxID=240449 RepID=A0ABC8XJT0_9POAL
MERAMVSASTGAMTSLLAKLTALLSEEYTKQKGVRRKIESMRDELGSMNALLVKLADAEELDGQLKQWRNSVRELAYDMEDCIDSFTLKLAHGDGAQPGVMKKMARKIKRLWARHKVANQIEELTARVKEVSDRRSRYKLDDESFIRSATHGHGAIDPRLPVLLAESMGLVGINGPRDVITGWLMDGEPHLKVVAIVGFGGLGKTTLAMEVYRSLGGHFHHKASTSVSRRLDLKKLTKDKRYLIVIDDVWSSTDWGLVKSVLPQNSHHSRVITTTRISSVAKCCSSDSKELIYEIEPLNNVDSRSLFMRRIFQPDDDCPSQLEVVSNAILKKCGGLPLAIITISSLLSTKPKIREQWERVKNGIGSSREEASTQMKNILLFSYYDLPYYLKTCLLYVSMFPEDHVIERRTLIWKWIAEGLVDEEMGQTTVEVGEAYFNELINRSMIQPVDIEYDGKARACRLHDVLLDILVALSGEENFVTICNGYGAKNLLGKIRRLSLHDKYTENEVEQLSTTDLVHVRSVHAFGSGKDIFDQLDCPAMRVLDLEGCSLWLQVKNIHKCLQLRYLNLRWAGITEVPNEIGNLQYLETLDLRGRSQEGKLPPAIGELRRLKHLLVSYKSELPSEITNLRALQVLLMPTINSVKLVEWLGELRELRELYMGSVKPDGIDELRRYKESFATSLHELGRHNLRLLHIYRHPDGSGVVNPLIDACFSSVPSPAARINPLVHISHLDTWVPTMEMRYLRVLGDLQCLLFLCITVDDFAAGVVESYLICSNGFQCLKEFEFDIYAPGGRIGLVFAPGAMPELQTLRLSLKAKGTKGDHGISTDFGLEHLSALKRVCVATHCYDGATTMEVESFEAAIRNAVSGHPNHSRIELALSRRGEHEMLKDSQEEHEVSAGQEGGQVGLREG